MVCLDGSKIREEGKFGRKIKIFSLFGLEENRGGRNIKEENKKINITIHFLSNLERKWVEMKIITFLSLKLFMLIANTKIKMVILRFQKVTFPSYFPS